MHFKIIIVCITNCYERNSHFEYNARQYGSFEELATLLQERIKNREMPSTECWFLLICQLVCDSALLEVLYFKYCTKY